MGMAKTDVDNKAAQSRQDSANAAQMAAAQLADSGATKRQASALESAAAEGAATRAANAAATDKTIAANRALNADSMANQLALFDKATDRLLSTTKAADAVTLQRDYRAAVQATSDSYLADVNKIQTADLDPADKAAQISALNEMYTHRQQLTNATFAATPGWAAEWQQIAVKFGGPG
jgi:peptidoglycan DL-endopeptidase CwlO